MCYVTPLINHTKIAQISASFTLMTDQSFDQNSAIGSDKITQEPLITLCHVIPLMDHNKIAHISTSVTLSTDQLVHQNSVFG